METPEDDNQGELTNVPEKEDKLLESKEDSADEDDDEDAGDVSKTSPEIKKPGSSERPTRERKLVKRYTESSTTRASFTKPVLIDKGRGTQLKDIPNVAFKLSKRKPDDNLQTLHSVMFGKRTKAHNLKKNLGMFSGYMWMESEHEKQRGKVKEKLDKCIKEKLVDFCDVLNIPINKTNSKKEDLCSKLLEFLECPHATTENLLSDKEKKGNKRKAKSTGGKITGSAEAVTDTPTKKQKKNSQAGEKRKRASETEEEDKVVGGDDAQDDNGDHESDSDVDESNTNVESDHESKPDPKAKPEEDDSKSSMPTEENSLKKIPKSENSVKKSSPAKSTKKAANKTPSSRSKKNKVKEEIEKDPNVVVAKEKKPRKKKESDKKTSTKKNKSNKEKVEAQIEKKTNKSQASTSSAKVLDNDLEEKGKKEPSRQEMHAVAEDIIKEADFNKVTLGDVVKQLGTHFGVDLMSRRDEIKGIIADILNSMSDDDESDSEDE
jgi:protein DEK